MNNKMIIVDTSVALKWLNESEQDRELAVQVYENHIEHKEEIIVPDLFYIEAANALTTKNVSSEEDIVKGIAFLFNSGLHKHAVTQENLTEAAISAKKYKTSVYDMLYAVIAKSKNAKLITADKKFARAVNLPYVQLLTE